MQLVSFLLKTLVAAALPALLLAQPVFAQDVIGSYAAYIGEDDLYNSEGARLTDPWQVLRQDRANYHRFGISQDGDEWDPFFGDAGNREAMETMIRRGYIDPDAEKMILSGGAMVYVNVYGAGDVGDYVEVEVFR